jgi:hypothetical protein
MMFGDSLDHGTTKLIIDLMFGDSLARGTTKLIIDLMQFVKNEEN